MILFLYIFAAIFQRPTKKLVVIVKTEAIILRTIKYGETSKILTLYTKEFGKISAIAKGARGTKSKFGNALEIPSYVALVLYKKDAREIQLIAESALLNRFGNIREQLDALSVAMATIELLYRTAHEEKNEPLFSLLVSTLTAINEAKKNFALFFCWFELRYADALGFRFQIEQCPSCKNIQDASIVQRPFFSVALSYGGILCPTCAAKSNTGMKIAPETFFLMNALLHHSLAEISTMEVSPQSLRETEQVLRAYLQVHIEGLGVLHSEKFFRIAAREQV